MYPKLVIQDNPKDEISQMQMAQQATEILLAGLRKDGEQQQNVFLVSAVKRVEGAVSSLDPGGIRGRTGEQHRKSGGGGTLRERTGKQCDGTGTVCSLCLCTFSAVWSEDRGTTGIRISSGGSGQCDPSGTGTVFTKSQKKPADMA